MHNNTRIFPSKLNSDVIEISYLCIQTYPCIHYCTITSNDKVTNCELKSWEIYEWLKKINTLIQKLIVITHHVLFLPQNRIKNKFHFIYE